eukprot:CAMPEP_0175517278 /NCGR_PEP_ID=MMETSP0096-20121207/14879_1 /TAXON_ID=311494 /ORGANISM="Alexandrium monilatum, Strain CCMP3105" /LENGTH=372 /DNA_ID=CAMNT_0016819595 /DNA_START=125 /DNA_END=1243 /DNA_ORIENTATION=-
MRCTPMTDLYTEGLEPSHSSTRSIEVMLSSMSSGDIELAATAQSRGNLDRTPDMTHPCNARSADTSGAPLEKVTLLSGCPRAGVKPPPMGRSRLFHPQCQSGLSMMADRQIEPLLSHGVPQPLPAAASGSSKAVHADLSDFSRVHRPEYLTTELEEANGDRPRSTGVRVRETAGSPQSAKVLTGDLHRGCLDGSEGPAAVVGVLRHHLVVRHPPVPAEGDCRGTLGATAGGVPAVSTRSGAPAASPGAPAAGGGRSPSTRRTARWHRGRLDPRAAGHSRASAPPGAVAHLAAAARAAVAVCTEAAPAGLPRLDAAGGAGAAAAAAAVDGRACRAAKAAPGQGSQAPHARLNTSAWQSEAKLAWTGLPECTEP